MSSLRSRAAQAIAEVESVARAGRAAAASRWHGAGDSFARLDLADASGQLRDVGRLTANFHPDRIATSGVSVVAGLVASGRYRSQWVTGISNGGRSATPGGDRAGWERELFGDAYTVADPAVDEFPIYGALDLLYDPHGGSPRFGSSYLVLRREVLARTTLCIGDSHAGATDIGTAGEPHLLLAGLAEQAAAGSLLDRPMGSDVLADVLRGAGPRRGADRSLDGYIEAQVHGGIDLARDVEAIIVDPSFRGTTHEADVIAVGRRYAVDIRWHRGSELSVDDVPDDFRGPTMPELAARVARHDGVVDARAIGVAAATLAHGPVQPAGDPPDSPAQQLKYLWHTVLAFGHDAVGSS